MSKMKQGDVEKIATKYVESIGTAPCLLDGSDFDEMGNPPVWRVFFSFCESSEEWVGLPHSLVIHVDDLTGEVSHINNL